MASTLGQPQEMHQGLLDMICTHAASGGAGNAGHAGSDCWGPVLRAALAPALSHGRAQSDPATGVKKFQNFIAVQGNLLEKEEALELLERRGKRR